MLRGLILSKHRLLWLSSRIFATALAHLVPTISSRSEFTAVGLCEPMGRVHCTATFSGVVVLPVWDCYVVGRITLLSCMWLIQVLRQGYEMQFSGKAMAPSEMLLHYVLSSGVLCRGRERGLQIAAFVTVATASLHAYTSQTQASPAPRP
jgi:hypothetical protein